MKIGVVAKEVGMSDSTIRRTIFEFLEIGTDYFIIPQRPNGRKKRIFRSVRIRPIGRAKLLRLLSRPS